MAEFVNPDYQLALAGALPAASKTDLELWSMMKPGDVLISGQFAGTPVITSIKTSEGSQLQEYATAQPQMPTWWTTGAGAPQNVQQLAQAVMPYNSALSSQIAESGKSADLWGQLTGWVSESRDKVILVAGAAAVVYMLASRK